MPHTLEQAPALLAAIAKHGITLEKQDSPYVDNCWEIWCGPAPDAMFFLEYMEGEGWVYAYFDNSHDVFQTDNVEEMAKLFAQEFERMRKDWEAEEGGDEHLSPLALVPELVPFLTIVREEATQLVSDSRAKVRIYNPQKFSVQWDKMDLDISVWIENHRFYTSIVECSSDIEMEEFADADDFRGTISAHLN